ncbi:MAG: glycosyltransferase [Pseudomonadota bacterium]|jgi:GT2 family glycosyltransferase|nr:glycosyltransferase [Pseudomonadota bacterium]
MTELPSVDIVVCVHNSLEDVERCITSARASNYPSDKLNLIIVDDGSDDETRLFLEKWCARKKRVDLIRRDQAGGYTIAANTGLRHGKSAFSAMLNSDTIVPKNWLKKITRIFADKPDVGIVGPLSNAASWQTVPERSAPGGGWMVNELPNGFSVDDMDRLVEGAFGEVAMIPRVTLLNGFCFVIRRAVCDEIGYLDEEGFPRGYGEEDDFCIRAVDAGFGLMVAMNTYVYHAKSKSYGVKTRSELSKRGQIVLKQKHSAARLERDVETMKLNPYLAKMRDAVARQQAEHG